MTTDLLAMLQLADSFFPSGMYTQSHGLERFVERGVRGEAQLAALFPSYLLHMAGPADALAARWVWRAAAQQDLALLEQIDQRLDATRLASEPRLASRRCGGRILQLGPSLFPAGIAARYGSVARQRGLPGHQAVALALLAHDAGLAEEQAVAVEIHSFVVSLTSAAVRLGVIDHIAAQRLILALRPAAAAAAALGHDRDWHMIGGFAPTIELMQIQHQYALNHMFAT
jgi:urease accessory protein